MKRTLLALMLIPSLAQSVIASDDSLSSSSEYYGTTRIHDSDTINYGTARFSDDSDEIQAPDFITHFDPNNADDFTDLRAFRQEKLDALNLSSSSFDPTSRAYTDNEVEYLFLKNLHQKSPKNKIKKERITAQKMVKRMVRAEKMNNTFLNKGRINLFSDMSDVEIAAFKEQNNIYSPSLSSASFPKTEETDLIDNITETETRTEKQKAKSHRNKIFQFWYNLETASNENYNEMTPN